MSVFGGNTGGTSIRAVQPGASADGYKLMHEGSVGSGAIGAVDTLYLYPFRLYAPETVKGIWTRCNTGVATAVLKTGIWRNDYATGRPTGVPVVSQNAGYDCSTNGIKSASVTETPLQPGVYWAGAVGGTAAANMNTASAAGVFTHSLIVLTAPNITAVGLSTPLTYTNDIAAADVTAASWTVLLSTSNHIPLMGIQVV